MKWLLHMLMIACLALGYATLSGCEDDNSLEDAADDVGDAVEDAGDEVQDALD